MCGVFFKIKRLKGKCGMDAIKLRDLNETDEEDIVTHLNNKDVIQYLSLRIPSPYTKKDAKWWVAEGSKHEIVKAIDYKGDFVGIIGVRRDSLERSHRGEIGYWLGKPFWNKGIATQAIDLMSQYIFVNTSIEQLYAPVFAPNEGSKQALLNNGFKLEAEIKKGFYKNHSYFDECIYCKQR